MVFEPQNAQLLARVPLFAELSDRQVRYLADRAVLRRFKDGEEIFAEGMPCEGLYVILSGSARLFKTAASGREQVLTIEMAGSTLAELPVFDEGPYPASASAIGDSTLLFIARSDFRALCLEEPEVALAVLKAVGRRLRRLVGLVEQLSFTTVRHRLADLLLEKAREGETTGRGVEFTLVENNQELAARIGTVRELVSRNLSRLQLEGIIAMEGKGVIVRDLERLKSEVESD
jgi:CRP/FNR family transcriptional regulator, cyclic AMP receptor protein